MELKVTFKDGDKVKAFKLAGDPVEVLDGVVSRVEKLWSAVFVTDQNDS